MAFGDFQRYLIVDRVLALAIQRLNELYAADGQVGFRMFHRTDGHLTDANAIKTLVMHARPFTRSGAGSGCPWPSLTASRWHGRSQARLYGQPLRASFTRSGRDGSFSPLLPAFFHRVFARGSGNFSFRQQANCPSRGLFFQILHSKQTRFFMYREVQSIIDGMARDGVIYVHRDGYERGSFYGSVTAEDGSGAYEFRLRARHRSSGRWVAWPVVKVSDMGPKRLVLEDAFGVEMTVEAPRERRN